MLLALALVSSPPGAWAGQQAETARILYVKPDARGDCSTWYAACDLHTALAAADPGDEIWVAAGVHYPGPVGVDRTATFQLKSEVALYGGFTGIETERQQRDWTKIPTLLSGDLDHNGALDNGNAFHVVTSSGTDATAILDGFTITGGNANGGGHYSGGGMFNESSHPTLANVTFSANSAIEGGGIYNLESSPSLTNVIFSDNSAVYSGAGIYNNASSPTLIDVTFSGNSASNGGGGMYNIFNSNPRLTKVSFTANLADTGGGMDSYESSPSLTDVTFSGNSADKGGGMYNAFGKPALTNVTFSGNSVTSWGGGMRNYFSDPTLTKVTFSGNFAAINGGGMYNEGSSPTLMEVTFSDNRAEYQGGAVYNSSSNPTLNNIIFSANHATYCGGMGNHSSSPRLTNSIFSHNWAVNLGGGMCNESSNSILINVTFSENSVVGDGDGMSNYAGSYSTLINVILWGNPAIPGTQIYNDETSTANVTYSIVQGGYAGVGNLDSDPLFANAARGNLRLRSDSPAIDAGNNAAVPVGITTDLNGDPRFVDMPDIADTGVGEAPVVDIGAYESHLLSIFRYLPLITKLPGE